MYPRIMTEWNVFIERQFILACIECVVYSEFTIDKCFSMEKRNREKERKRSSEIKGNTTFSFLYFCKYFWFKLFLLFSFFSSFLLMLFIFIGSSLCVILGPVLIEYLLNRRLIASISRLTEDANFNT